uniref:TF-B3 domain-containing protein n=1 Tax=Kalanchoe fedtschenkoi TaxID=63787 RepID=A0A7N0ZVR1_KALFE
MTRPHTTQSSKMVMPSYEQCRQKRLEENKKRMEALNLPQLAKTLREISTPPRPTPAKRRPYAKQLVAVRRSPRVANMPAGPVYVEVDVAVGRLSIPRRLSKPRAMSGAYATNEAREWSITRAEELQSALDQAYPSFVRPMLPSHVSSCFWLGLPSYFCKQHLPKQDTVMTLVDEKGDEYPTRWLPRKTGLSGGWKGFAVARELVDGDALVFQLISPTAFKVYIVRVEGFKEGTKQ